MDKFYIKFQSTQKSYVSSGDCTTRWPSDISCKIPLSGNYLDRFTNLMVMEGDSNKIVDWIDRNHEKVEELTYDEINTVGNTISPEGREVKYEDPKGITKTYILGSFNIDDGQSMVEKIVVDYSIDQ